jgi:Rieske Fe-S protein
MMQSPNDPNAPDRRDFMKKACSVVIGGAIGAVPVAAGLAVYMDPLRRKAEGGLTVRVASLDALPNDGVPRKFPVLASRTDAWTKTAETPIGAVYLRRTADGKVTAFNVVCPHAGCFVDFMPDRGSFLCPCHDSTFTLEGRVASPRSPAARGLDELTCHVRNEKEIWVEFQNFQGGHAEKKPLA